MDDKVYMPPKPVNQFTQPPCGSPCPPERPMYEYPTTPPPPPPPCKPSPDGFPWVEPPPFKQIPPIPTVCEGESLYEAMNAQIKRTNACVEQWNAISRNCFAAMNACVEAARSNDVYYDDCEVHYQTGYDENEGCAYSLVEKKAVDRQGRPIFVKMCLAYDNTTNSGVKQDIFDVSFIKSANVIMTAVPTAQLNWYGPAMYRGAPIPGIDQNIVHPIEGQDPIPPLVNTGWVYGFNRQGWLRVFEDTVTETDLCQNGMIDVLGSCWPILSNGEVTDTAKELTTKASITAIGFNKGTGSVFFFSCSAQDNPGMTGISVAKLLQGYGCTTAVLTSMIDGTDKTQASGMLYMGQMTSVPQGGLTPTNLAYWVISKRANFKNRFQKEIADLVQTTGQNAWKNYLLGVQIQDFDDRIKANAEAIKAEQERAIQAEKWLQENINKEVNRAMQAEEWLQVNINKEVERATAAETALNKKIDDETTRATEAEQNLHQEIVDETNRATAAENANAAAIAAEKLRAITRENEIQAALDKEVRERISADNDIINAIEQEVLARRAADTALENKIDAVKNELKIDINNLQNIINGITGGQTELPYLKLTGGTLSGPLTMSENNTVTLGRGPTEDMEAATKKYVDDAIATGGGGGTGGDVSKEYVDQQVSNLQNQITGKVSKSGDTMTGALDMDGNKIENAVLSSNTGTTLDNGAGGPGILTNLANPVNPTDAVNYQTLQQDIEQAKTDLSDEFLPTAGGEMTGDINMTDSSAIKFYDAQQQQADLAKAAVTPTSTLELIKPSKAAQRLGITAELMKDAASRGVNLASATNNDIVTALDIDPRDLTGQIYRGAITNENENMKISSESGEVIIEGLEVLMQDQAGSDVNVMGVKQIGPVGEAAIKFDPTDTKIMGPVKIVNAIDEPSSSIQAGLVKIGDIELEPHTNDSEPEHLDINVPTDTGAVYINRSADGVVVPGGTGEINLTEIHSPQQLIIRPATSMSLNNKQIKNVADATDPQDALTLQSIQNGSVNIPGLGPIERTLYCSVNINNIGVRIYGIYDGNIYGYVSPSSGYNTTLSIELYNNAFLMKAGAGNPSVSLTLLNKKFSGIFLGESISGTDRDVDEVTITSNSSSMSLSSQNKKTCINTYFEENKNPSPFPVEERTEPIEIPENYIVVESGTNLNDIVWTNTVAMSKYKLLITFNNETQKMYDLGNEVATRYSTYIDIDDIPVPLNITRQLRSSPLTMQINFGIFSTISLLKISKFEIVQIE